MTGSNMVDAVGVAEAAYHHSANEGCTNLFYAAWRDRECLY